MRAPRLEEAALEEIHGFLLVEEKEIPEYRSLLRRLRHAATGLDLVHLLAEDQEETFGIVLRTPALDDTGVSHIVEHSVLCGSRRFPLKDPLVHLLRGSMSTYLNAWTFPDKTVYPGASTITRDFFNLLTVYADAVFFPLLAPEVFCQEGHRLEFGPDGRPRIVGVVYNEMRGVYSNPESVAARWAVRSLFPDTTYGRDSGGDPQAIPTLTYEQFVAYHRRFYHPSNARVFVHGPVPTEQVLELLQGQFLREFDRHEPDSEIAPQPTWGAPRVVERPAPLGAGEGVAARATILLNWRLPEATDGFLLAALEVLEEALLGNPGSPLRKALVESGLGEDLSPASGLDSELRWPVFSAGLRGTEPQRRAAVEELVLETLQGLASRGIPSEVLEGAIQRVEFRNREIRRPGGPMALELMRRALRGWLHGAAPEATLVFAPWIDRIRGMAGEGLIEDLIKRELLDNPHRCTLVVRPEPGVLERVEQETNRRLEEALRTLRSEEWEQLRERNLRLARFQESPDDPQALAALPRLALEDLPRRVECIPRVERSPAGVRFLLHEMFASQVAYIDVVYSVPALEAELLPFLSLLPRFVPAVGLPGRPYDLVARELARVCGGFGGSIEVGLAVSGQLGCYVVFRLKALERTAQAAWDLAASLLAAADFSDSARLADLLRESRNRLRASLLPAGSRYAALRAGARLRPSLALGEMWEGVSQVLFQSSLDPSKDAPRVAEALERVRASVLRAPIAVGLTGDRLEELEALMTPPAVERGAQTRGPFSVGCTPPERPPGICGDTQDSCRAEVLLIPSGVGYVAQVMEASPFGTPENAAESVLAHLLATGPLWERVRARGGAYGASAWADGMERVFTFSTYRDPDVAATVEVLREVLARVADSGVEESSVREAVIGCVARDSRPMAPGEKGGESLRRVLYGIDDTLRQRRRDALLEVTAASVREAAARLGSWLERGVTVVMATRPAVEAAARACPELAEALQHPIELDV